jgi:hypothetical protein
MGVGVAPDAVLDRRPIFIRWVSAPFAAASDRYARNGVVGARMCRAGSAHTMTEADRTSHRECTGRRSRCPSRGPPAGWAETIPK